MEIVKKYITGIVLLLIVGIIWLGLNLIRERVFSDVNPNATTYTKPLNKEFDMEILGKVAERTEKSFPVLPSEFFDLDDN